MLAKISHKNYGGSEANWEAQQYHLFVVLMRCLSLVHIQVLYDSLHRWFGSFLCHARSLHRDDLCRFCAMREAFTSFTRMWKMCLFQSSREIWNHAITETGTQNRVAMILHWSVPTLYYFCTIQFDVWWFHTHLNAMCGLASQRPTTPLLLPCSTTTECSTSTLDSSRRPWRCTAGKPSCWNIFAPFSSMEVENVSCFIHAWGF